MAATMSGGTYGARYCASSSCPRLGRSRRVQCRALMETAADDAERDAMQTTIAAVILMLVFTRTFAQRRSRDGRADVQTAESEQAPH